MLYVFHAQLITPLFTPPRLTPVYMLVLMVYANLWHYMGAGPWMLDVDVDADSCKDVWWKNMLYINNFWDLGSQVPGVRFI